MYNAFAATLTAFAGSSIMTMPEVILNPAKPSDDSTQPSDDFEHEPKLPKDREIIF